MKKELQIGILIWILERLSETDWVDGITQMAIKSYTKALSAGNVVVATIWVLHHLIIK